MRTNRLLSLLALFTLTSAASAQGTGPDVIVGDLNSIDSYGTNGASGIWAYAVGTDACNIGTAPLAWNGATNQHPVIAQNLYRLKNGRFEQIGMSWLKHGFYALSLTLCGSCPNGNPNGTSLNVGCSDPYVAALNGFQGNGPRSEVDASKGTFPFPFGSYPAATPVIGRRIQCATADVDPAQNAGALYYAEGQYVSPDDSLSGNQNNNASYRRIQFATQTSPSLNYVASFNGATVQQQPAILAWQANDPAVVISYYDVPNDGRFIIAKKVTSIGGGAYHYEFAIHNLNSDKSGRGFTVDFPVGTWISNAGFHDVSYHSGEPYSGTDWPVSFYTSPYGSSVKWATDYYVQNPNANALRWGTLYNFWFDSSAPAENNATIELFKPTCLFGDPVVPYVGGYTLNLAAAFDNPALPAPVAGPSGDDVSMNVPIGFTFKFYGANYTTANLCTNGFLSFNSSSTAYANQCLPTNGAPNASILAYWDDLVAPAGSVTYQTIGSAPNRRFVASWSGVSHFGGPGILESFKIILDETTNLVTTSIVSSLGYGTSATRGVQDATGTTATLASCNYVGNPAPSGTSQTYTPFTTVVPSADLMSLGGGTGPNGTIWAGWLINSNAVGAPVILLASFDPGPTSLGALGTLNLGLVPGLYAVVADGAGLLQPANPLDVTDGCGDVVIAVNFYPLPPGLTIYWQGVVLTNTSNPPPPNGLFHITDLEIWNT